MDFLLEIRRCAWNSGDVPVSALSFRVRHTRMEIGRVGRDFQSRGLAVFGINPNDTDAFPQDGPEGMKQEVAIAGYT